MTNTLVDALVVQGASEMVVVDEVVLLAGAEIDRDHVRAQEFLEIGSGRARARPCA